jgi:hypothetical protein
MAMLQILKVKSFLPDKKDEYSGKELLSYYNIIYLKNKYTANHNNNVQGQIIMRENLRDSLLPPKK